MKHRALARFSRALCSRAIAKLYQRVTAIIRDYCRWKRAVTPAKPPNPATSTMLQQQRIVLSLLHTPPGPLAEFSQRTASRVPEKGRLDFVWWLGRRPGVCVTVSGLALLASGDDTRSGFESPGSIVQKAIVACRHDGWRGRHEDDFTFLAALPQHVVWRVLPCPIRRRHRRAGAGAARPLSLVRRAGPPVCVSSHPSTLPSEFVLRPPSRGNGSIRVHQKSLTNQTEMTHEHL